MLTGLQTWRDGQEFRERQDSSLCSSQDEAASVSLPVTRVSQYFSSIPLALLSGTYVKRFRVHGLI